MVLLVYYCGRGDLHQHVYMLSGHSGKHCNRQRYIPISNIAATLGVTLCKCLPTAHALTGCDTTSACFKIGKRTAFSKLLQNQDKLASLATVGMSSEITETFSVARQYILLLYGAKAKQCSSLDELRYQYACTSDKAGSMFPPTDDAFKQHFLRVNYQVALWIHSHLPKPVLWLPVGNGWKINSDGFLVEVMFEKEAAPVELRAITHLYCTDNDCVLSKRCHCVASGLPCTQFCSCGATENCGNCASVLLDGESGDDIGQD